MSEGQRRVICYDRWIADMREMALKYPQAGSPLKAAATQFALEAEALNACADVLFPERQIPQEMDPDMKRLASGVVSEAREGYALAIGEIEHGLAAMRP